MKCLTRIACNIHKYIYKRQLTKKENIEVNVNINTDETEIYIYNKEN